MAVPPLLPLLVLTIAKGKKREGKKAELFITIFIKMFFVHVMPLHTFLFVLLEEIDAFAKQIAR